MIDFQQKKRIKSIIYSKGFLVLLFILVIFLSRPTYDIYKKSKFSYDNYARVKREYDNLKARKYMLTTEIDRLKTDYGVEEEIRSKFNVAKPGETVVTILNSNSTSSSTNDTNKDSWLNFWGIFN